MNFCTYFVVLFFNRQWFGLTVFKFPTIGNTRTLFGMRIDLYKIQKFPLNLTIMTYQVDILIPKADKLLQDLADLKLISLSKVSNDPFLTVVKQLRRKAAAIKTPTLEEITKEVESVRAKRYGNKTKG
jgi:hypothetical protein